MRSQFIRTHFHFDVFASFSLTFKIDFIHSCVILVSGIFFIIISMRLVRRFFFSPAEYVFAIFVYESSTYCFEIPKLACWIHFCRLYRRFKSKKAGAQAFFYYLTTHNIPDEWYSCICNTYVFISSTLFVFSVPLFFSLIHAAQSFIHFDATLSLFRLVFFRITKYTYQMESNVPYECW